MKKLKYLGEITSLLQYFSGNITVTETTKKYAATGIGTGLAAGDTVYFESFVDTDSNGLKTLVTVAANEITVSETVGANETAAATMKEQATTAWTQYNRLYEATGVINCFGDCTVAVDQSGSGSGVADYSSEFDVTGGTALMWAQVSIGLPYVRLRVLNGAADQTTMNAVLNGWFTE